MVMFKYYLVPLVVFFFLFLWELIAVRRRLRATAATAAAPAKAMTFLSLFSLAIVCKHRNGREMFDESKERGIPDKTVGQ